MKDARRTRNGTPIWFGYALVAASFGVIFSLSSCFGTKLPGLFLYKYEFCASEVTTFVDVISTLEISLLSICLLVIDREIGHS